MAIKKQPIKALVSNRPTMAWHDDFPGHAVSACVHCQGMRLHGQNNAGHAKQTVGRIHDRLSPCGRGLQSRLLGNRRALRIWRSRPGARGQGPGAQHAAGQSIRFKRSLNMNLADCFTLAS